MKIKVSFLILLLFFFARSSAWAGTYSYNCVQSAVSCDNLLTNIVTNKFTKAYDYKVWEIFIYSATTNFSDGSGVHNAIVGVVRKSQTEYEHFPKRWRTYVSYQGDMGNAFERKESLKQTIKKAAESLMADCDDSPTCSIHK